MLQTCYMLQTQFESIIHIDDFGPNILQIHTNTAHRTQTAPPKHPKTNKPVGYGEPQGLIPYNVCAYIYIYIYVYLYLYYISIYIYIHNTLN